jgi:putative SOS response-associated peptidase YedK
VPERVPSGRDLQSLTPAEVQARREEFERRIRIARRAPPERPGPLSKTRDDFLWIYVNCARPGCGHFAAVPLTPLIVRWGPDATLERLRRAARCTRCGHLGATTQLNNAGWPANLSGISEPTRWTGREVWPCEISNELDGRVFGANFDQHFHPVLGTINFDAMCNLYSNTRSRQAIADLFRVSDNRAYAFEPMPAIFPRSVAPIVRLASDGERELVPATWGYPLIRKGYAPKPVTNVRDDTVLTSPFWRPSFEARRCLVPASSYCEPDSNSPAGWHWFALLNGAAPAPAGPDAQVGIRRAEEERPLFAFPGIWKRYRGPMKKDGPDVEVDVYAFMTTAPNSLTATIMHDRMPVLLSEPAEWETWLTGSPDAAYGLVRTYDAERMRIVQSGAEKRDLLGAAV